MPSKKIRSALIELSRLPDTDRALWLEGAITSVEFLKKNYLKDDEILLYGYGRHFLAHSVLVRNAAVDPPDHNSLSKSRIMPDDSWCIQHSYSDKEGRRVYIQPPLSNTGCRSLVDGEKLVFLRDFEGIKSFEPQFEINQKLLHSLNLHFVDERQAYCRLDNRGDIEDVIKIFVEQWSNPEKRIRAASIKRRDLATYMTLTEMSLIVRFEFMRFIPGKSPSWDYAERKTYEDRDMFYKCVVAPDLASNAHGHIILRTSLTSDDLAEQWRAEKDVSNRKYAIFKIFDWKNNRQVETSCSLQHITNYLAKSNLPWEISPAFFRPEVLHRFKADLKKHTIDDRRIGCRNAWFLKTYDINEAGQVHTYIGYLANLPYEEQLYWQSFNEWPKDGISKRALQTDILGQFPDEVDPLVGLKMQIKSLDSFPPSWWKPRGEEIIDKVLDPATDSVEEWGNEVLAFDHLIVEGFLVKPLKAIIEANGGKYEKDWRSLKLLELGLSKTGCTDEQAKKIVEPIRELHGLRNAMAHSDPTSKDNAVALARKRHHTLRNHFKYLTIRIRDSMNQIIATLPKS